MATELSWRRGIELNDLVQAHVEMIEPLLEAAGLDHVLSLATEDTRQTYIQLQLHQRDETDHELIAIHRGIELGLELCSTNQ